MYLKRKLDRILEEWKKNPDRLPLIVKGPRQVGKTSSVLNFAATHYESVVEINFLTDPRYGKILENGYAAESVLGLISLINPGVRLIPGKTLIFFDEIQACPDVATTLKFFKADGRYDVICSGSMLGLSYRAIHSVSVGFKEDIDLYSLDFEEFLWAMGYREDAVEALYARMRDMKPLLGLELEVFSKLFFDYCVLGGMPAVVRQYAERRDFTNSLRVQRQIMADYEEDVRKYLEGMDQARVLQVLRSVPAQLAKENKKFQLGKVRTGARAREYWGCIEWLESAGLVNVCRCLGFPELPLGGNEREGFFKLYFCDTGLLVSCLDEESQDDLRENRNLGVYKGGLFENIAAEALVKSGKKLCYWANEARTLETDFFLRTQNTLVPVEIKAKSGKAKTQKTLIESDRWPDIRFGVKLSGGNIGKDGRVYTFPIFCAFLLGRWLKENGSRLEAENP